MILWHSAYGTGAVKTNSKTDDPAAKFNPYCKTATGQVTGQYQVTSEVPFAWDPVNKGEKLTMPVIGTFKITYSATMTERIRGIADWSKIFSIVMMSMNVKKEVMEDYQEAFMWLEPDMSLLKPKAEEE